MKMSGQFLLSLNPVYNKLQAKTNTRGLPLFLNAAPCSRFNKLHSACITGSLPKTDGFNFAKYIKLWQSIKSGFHLCDLRSLTAPTIKEF